MIQNLKERLQNLEEKVNVIAKEDARDKSQQRIKDAIVNLETKLEQFRREKELNNKELEQFQTYSSFHSSSQLPS